MSQAVGKQQSIDHEAALFDILEALTRHFPDLAGGFARGTGGVDLPFILDTIRAGVLLPEAWRALEERMREIVHDELAIRSSRRRDAFIASAEVSQSLRQGSPISGYLGRSLPPPSPAAGGANE